MRFTMHISFLLITMLLVFSCAEEGDMVNGDGPPQKQIEVPAFGTGGTLEVATWNIENFPKAQEATVWDVKEIIKDLKIDIFAVEEITNRSSFQALLDSLPGYEGRLADFPSWVNLLIGIIYDTSLVTILRDTLLFLNDYDYPRPAYSLYLRVTHNSQTLDFTLIVLHLKAFGDLSAEGRRRRAVQKLKAYIDNRRQGGGDPDYIVAGDWNDVLEDPREHNVFLPFLDDSLNYYFLTLPFAGSSTEYSYIGSTNYRTLIDHILVTRSIIDAYPAIETRVLKLDQHFSAYLEEVSDHRPVATKIPVF